MEQNLLRNLPPFMGLEGVLSCYTSTEVIYWNSKYVLRQFSADKTA
jgi:hypothetical protein